jgi:nitrous oxide reductase
MTRERQLLRRALWGIPLVVAAAFVFSGCPGTKQTVNGGDVAQRVYVAPGQYDEFYGFFSGGFSGQVTVYGLPSGRLFKIILAVVGSLCWLIVPLWQAARTFVRKDF